MNFKCPYCNQHTTITNPNKYTKWEQILVEISEKGQVGLSIYAITCPNIDCRKLYLKVSLTNVANNQATRWQNGPTKELQTWQLLPESSAKVLPDYIPVAVKEDYYEACRIRDLSPKASATLSRRCIQGMIRDFWKISKSRLVDEIDALKEKVDSLTWDAIDSVRKVGNIGAHMEKDINLIIDVEPNEAQLLIELIEQLVDDWYVAKHDKEERLKKIKEIAEKKKDLKLKGGE